MVFRISSSRLSVVAVATAVVGVLAMPAAMADTEDIKLTASDAAAFDDFGRAVAISGDTVVVGAFGNDDDGIRSGSAYVFKPDGSGGYTQTKLTASDADPFDEFGRAVAISGDTIVVGAEEDNDSAPLRADSGSAYVFKPDGVGGYTDTKLTASDALAFDAFGHSVAVSGDIVVVGAWLDDAPTTNSGSAYVFKPDGVGGYTETKLTASDAAAGDTFGTSVAISGDIVVVGARGNDDAGPTSGSAYVFVHDGAGGYTETKLTASDAEGGGSGDDFGISVAVSGTTVVVGAYGNNDDGFRSGSAYVFKPDGAGGYVETKLTASDGAAEDDFGISVAVSGEVVLVGASGNDDGGSNAGSAYLFMPDGAGGYVETKLTASDAAGGHRLGLWVGLSDEAAVAGAFGVSDLGTRSGGAYVFDVAVADVIAPLVAITSPLDGSFVDQSQLVLADFECTDEVGGSGLASCDGDVPVGSAIDTATVGPSTFTVTGIDNAGNETTVVHNFTVQPTLVGVGVDLEEIVDDNPGTPLADKVEDALAALNTALEELEADPPDNQAALGAIEGAVNDLEAAVSDGLLDPTEGAALMDSLSEIARTVAADAISNAVAQGGDPVALADASDALAAGDALRATEDFKDAVGQYKDALAKAEGSLP